MESLVGNRITSCFWAFVIQVFQHDNSTMFECVSFIQEQPEPGSTAV